MRRWPVSWSVRWWQEADYRRHLRLSAAEGEDVEDLPAMRLAAHFLEDRPSYTHDHATVGADELQGIDVAAEFAALQQRRDYLTGAVADPLIVEALPRDAGIEHSTDGILVARANRAQGIKHHCL